MSLALGSTMYLRSAAPAETQKISSMNPTTIVRGFIVFLEMDLNFEWRLSRVSDSGKTQVG
jgi:hypothetical protein